LSTALFWCWKYEVNASLRRSGISGLQFTPSGCVGWYFVPIAQLFKPYQAMRELWSATDPYPYDRRQGEAVGWIVAWWGILVVGGGICLSLYVAVSRLLADDDKINTLYNQLQYEPFYLLFGLALSIVCFLLITKVSRRLGQRLAIEAANDEVGRL
jgi:hypothetical protein